MNIGFDIDGVLTDFEKFVATYGCKFLKTTIKNIKISQINDDDIAEMFNCDALEREQRLNKEDLNERRKRLNESKTRCNDYLNKGKPEAEKRDIGKTYEIRKQSQGRR